MRGVTIATDREDKSGAIRLGHAKKGPRDLSEDLKEGTHDAFITRARRVGFTVGAGNRLPAYRSSPDIR